MPITTPNLSQIPITTVDLRPKPKVYYPVTKSTEIPSKEMTSQVSIGEYRRTHVSSPTEQLTIQVPKKTVDLRQQYSKTTENLQYEMPITTPELTQIPITTVDLRSKPKKPQEYHPIVKTINIPSQVSTEEYKGIQLPSQTE